jgi:predicted lipoprotein with Yx(FWY)xxD motif
MNRARYLVRIAAGVGALVLAGAGVAAATTPPTEPPADTAAATDTAMVADTAAADTAIAETSGPAAGGGPSNCPAIGAEAPATSAAAGTAGTAMVEDTAAADTAAAGTAAADTAMVEDTAAADTAMGTEPAAEGPFVQVAESAEYGPILVDSQCRSLYVFAADTEGEPTCVDDCAANWPPLFVEGDTVPPLADELDPSLFSIVEHAEGPMLKVGDWPLYYFAGDAAPGDINGQGVGGNWWLVAPDGTPYEEAAEGTAPAGTEPAGTEMAGTAPATTTG